ncbi:hypothetical protein Btru_036546, partial [Bulinus truncatus]
MEMRQGYQKKIAAKVLLTPGGYRNALVTLEHIPMPNAQDGRRGFTSGMCRDRTNASPHPQPHNHRPDRIRTQVAGGLLGNELKTTRRGRHTERQTHGEADHAGGGDTRRGRHTERQTHGEADTRRGRQTECRAFSDRQTDRR